MEKVILVDMFDAVVGEEEKLAAHKNSLLHRAFSVFLYNGSQLLMHKRQSEKYHCGGLWTNTCCSHPRMQETIPEAAKRRLWEEMGICYEDSTEVFSFVYIHKFENGLTEFEYDHVLIGEYHGNYSYNSEEIEEVQWIDIDFLMSDIVKEPQKYTPWFITALPMVYKHIM